VLFGIWLTISPWMFGDSVFDHAVQITITGVLLVLTAGASVLFGSATALPLWFALVLGLWTMATPIMFGLSGRSFLSEQRHRCWTAGPDCGLGRDR
jgi:hypothetical protein